MNQLFLSIDVLIKVANLAQSKGILTLEEAKTVHESIEVQQNHYKELSEQLKAQDVVENTKPDQDQTPERKLSAKKVPVKR